MLVKEHVGKQSGSLARVWETICDFRGNHVSLCFVGGIVKAVEISFYRKWYYIDLFFTMNEASNMWQHGRDPSTRGF